MAGKHTSGPWSIKQFGGPQISGPNGYAVATMWGALNVSELQGQDLANARLIAAAPDLLSIVERFVALPSGAWHPERHAAEEAELMQEARAAIAKAKGEDGEASK